MAEWLWKNSISNPQFLHLKFGNIIIELTGLLNEIIHGNMLVHNASLVMVVIFPLSNSVCGQSPTYPWGFSLNQLP